MTNKRLLPEWANSAVFYEIYPQTFKDSCATGIGDIRGMIEKLDYVATTGSSAIWLNPFYLSPMNDAGYDVADYYQVDPRYGRMQDIVEFFDRAKQKGIRVIIDFVPGHTSIEHAWFKESAKENPMRPFKNWYIWTNSAWDKAGKWAAKMVHGYGKRDGNFLINFFSNQPALNFGFTEPEAEWQLPTTHPDVQELWREMRQVMRFWLEKGCSGFRVDMADSLIRNDPDKKEIRRFWRETREELAPDFPDLFMVGEGHPSNILGENAFHSAYLHWVPTYWSLFRSGETRSQTGELQKTTAYFDENESGSTTAYMETFLDEYNKTKDAGVISVPVGNHDLPRVAVGQSESLLEIIQAFHMSFPGIPYIYYGDEIGMRQIKGTKVHEGHYATRNGARTPMQWSDKKNLGFSECERAQLYLEIDPAKDAPHVKEQETRKDSLLNKVRGLVSLHKEEIAFRAQAGFELIQNGDANTPLVFKRISEDKTREVLCLFSPGKKDMMFDLTKNHSWKWLDGNKAELKDNKVILGNNSYSFILKK